MALRGNGFHSPQTTEPPAAAVEGSIACMMAESSYHCSESVPMEPATGLTAAAREKPPPGPGDLEVTAGNGGVPGYGRGPLRGKAS